MMMRASSVFPLWLCRDLCLGIIFVSMMMTSVYFIGYINLLSANPSRLVELGVTASLANSISLIIEVVWIAIFWSASGFILYKRPHRHIAWLVATVGFMLPVRVGFIQVIPLQSITPHFPIIAQVAFLGVFAFMAYFTIAVFPQGNFSPPWTRYLVLIRLGVCFNYVFNLVPVLNARWVWVDIIMFVCLITSKIYAYRHHSTTQERQQTKWFLLGVVIGLTCFFIKRLADTYMVSTELYVIVYLLSRLAVVTLPFAMTFAILRYRLYDVDVVINRGLVYATMTLALGIVFFGLVLVMQLIIDVFMSEANAQAIAVAVSSMVIGFLFNATRQKIQGLINRHVFRLRLEPTQMATIKAVREAELGLGTLSGVRLGGALLERLIGKGGMGRVYRAVWQGRTVAVKILPSEMAEDPDNLERFRREVAIITTINHPNIVKLEGSGTLDGVPYIVMELIEGEELGNCLRREKRLPLDQVRLIIRDIASALDYLHEQGIVHRDIKPNNVVLQDTRAVLMDFGLARFLHRTNPTTGGVLGTVEYVAPEQIHDSHTITHHADIYSLAVLAYRMLVGETPFRGGMQQVLLGHIELEPPDPRELNPDLPQQTAFAITKALSKRPEGRFATAGDFARQL
jgi:tRNA A-37 threonylcarbamoyl transferase component Bud32